MKRVITDTNIWYQISQRDINNISKDYKLVIPIIVLNELYTSPNVYKSSETLASLKKAVKIILHNVDKFEFIKHDPFEYILKEIKPDLYPRLSVTYYLNEFENLLRLDFDILKKIHPERSDISGLTNNINFQSINYKKIVDRDKQKFKKLDTRNFTESLILRYANDNLESLNSLYPKIVELDKNKYSLLINTFDGLLREVSKSGKKIRDNDWIDIFNLTYTSNNDLYWSKEKNIINLIKNAGLEHLLFKDS